MAIMCHIAFLAANAEYIVFPERSPGYSGWAPFGDGGARLQYLGTRFPQLVCVFVFLVTPYLALYRRPNLSWTRVLGVSTAAAQSLALALSSALPSLVPFPRLIETHLVLMAYDHIVALCLLVTGSIALIMHLIHAVFLVRYRAPTKALAALAVLSVAFMPYTFWLELYLFFD